MTQCEIFNERSRMPRDKEMIDWSKTDGHTRHETES